MLEALAHVATSLPARSRETLTEALRAVDLVSEFAAYLPLVQEDPSLLPDEAGTAARASFAADFDVTGAAFQIVQLHLGQDPPVDQQDAFVNAASARIASQLSSGDTAAIQNEVRALAAAAQKLQRASASVAEGAMTSLSGGFAQAIAHDVAPDVLDFVAVCARLAGDSGRPAIDPFLQTYSQQAPDGLIAYAHERGEALPPMLREALLPVLAVLAGPGHPTARQEAAADAILVLTPNDEAGFLAGAVSQAAAQDDFATVETHLDHYGGVLADSLQSIAESLLTRAQSIGASAAVAALPPLLQLAGEMSEEQRGRLRERLRETIISLGSSSLDALANVLLKAEEARGFVDEFTLLVREIWDHLKGQADPPLPLFAYVAQRLPRLDPDRRAALLTQFGLWIVQLPQARLPLSERLATAPEFKAAERTQLVERMIEAEGLEADVHTRAGLLRVARTVTGPSNSAAMKRLTARIAALEHGSAEDQQVYELVSGS